MLLYGGPIYPAPLDQTGREFAWRAYLEEGILKYCITGIFPGTFISRKMMYSTFSRFLISRPAHGCTDI